MPRSLYEWIDPVLTAAGAVGNLFDLPGSSVRDVLAWENPLDQWLSPFSGENRTGGRDLLRQYGLVDSEDTWGNFGAGMGAEALLDPFTWGVGGMAARPLRGGGKAAKAAKAAGTAPRMAEAIAPPTMAAIKSPDISGLLPAPTPPFYSRLERTLEELPGQNIKAQSLENMLKKSREGISQDEFNEVLGDPGSFADAGSTVLNKQQLLNEAKRNRIEIKPRLLTEREVPETLVGLSPLDASEQGSLIGRVVFGNIWDAVRPRSFSTPEGYEGVIKSHQRTAQPLAEEMAFSSREIQEAIPYIHKSEDGLSTMIVDPASGKLITNVRYDPQTNMWETIRPDGTVSPQHGFIVERGEDSLYGIERSIGNYDIPWRGIELAAAAHQDETLGLLEQIADDPMSLEEAFMSVLGKPQVTVERMDPRRYDTYTVPGGTEYTEMLLEVPSGRYARGSAPNHWKGHGDNVAHVRFDTRTGQDGSKVLFVQEIQSDVHQAARKGKDTGLPFGDRKWLDLALKHVVDHASRNGYDRIAFNRGHLAAVFNSGMEDSLGSKAQAIRKWIEEDVPKAFERLYKRDGVQMEPVLLDVPRDGKSMLQRFISYTIPQGLKKRVVNEGQPLMSLLPFALATAGAGSLASRALTEPQGV
ncbi:MAG: hypothetical protein ACOY3P_20195 [Planctomycetota bacterium]